MSRGRHKDISQTQLPSFGLAFLAAFLFSLLFLFRGFKPLDFWWGMSASIGLLVALSLIADHAYHRFIASDLAHNFWPKIMTGVLTAIILYGIFLIGEITVTGIFNSAAEGIGGVYSLKGGASLLRISLLITIFIGPGEELFWRGYLQRRWQDKYGAAAGFILTASAYTLVHIASGNLLLILAAFVCGFFWGALYLRYRSVLLNVVSHTVWDLLIFIIFPL